MMFDVLATVVAGLTFSFLPGAHSAPCLSGTVALNVTSTSDIQHLTEELNCTGPGAFKVTWCSSLTLVRRIDISNMKNVTVTGSGFPTIRGGLDDNNDGGAIVVSGSGTGIFSVSNESTLRLNNVVLAGGKAENGGAVDLLSSSTLFVTGCRFIDNSATMGGAIYANASEVYIDGNSTFTYNYAHFHGGAVCASLSDIYINGSAQFSNNTADDSGGAVYAASSDIYMEGSTMFSSNTAGEGGAIYGSSTNLCIAYAEVPTGTLSRNEGEAYSEGAGRSTNHSVAFVENFALSFGGAMFLDGYDALQVTGGRFESNKAEFGGAVYLASVGNKQSEFSTCAFEGNKATDGGAIYLYTGKGVVTSSVFHGNYARFAGGAIYHTGSLRVANNSFVANVAGVEGVAIISIGVLDALSNVSFADNMYDCSAGQYGYLHQIEEDFCSDCFDEVCARCLSSYGGFFNGEAIRTANFPVCAEPPHGAGAPSSGTTVSDLYLEYGHYRTSSQSHVVFECPLPEACWGGNDAGSYCAPGYEGHRCAVCEEGFTEGLDGRCNACPERAYLSAVLLGGMLVFVLFSWVVLFFYLVRVANDDRREEIVGPRGRWRGTWSSLLDVIDKGLPLSAIKTTVVVWQIITQFTVVSGNLYSPRYAMFISIIRVVNVDFGYLFSFACILRFNFYHHLLLATIGPFVVILMLGGTYALVKYRHNISETALRSVWNRLVSVAIFVVVFVYASVTFTIFQTFSCELLDDGISDGISYLRADYSISCSTNLHTVFRAYAIVMVGIYTFGIPAWFLWWLLRNRKYLKTENRKSIPHLQPFCVIWIAYTPSRYFYEVLECGRRIIFAASAIFGLFDGRAQPIVAVLNTVVPLLLDALQPFDNGVDMALYRWGNVIVLGSVYMEFISGLEDSMESFPVVVVMSDVLLFGNLAMVATVLAQGVLLVVNSRVVNTVTVVDFPVRNASLEMVRRPNSEHGRDATPSDVQ